MIIISKIVLSLHSKLLFMSVTTVKKESVTVRPIHEIAREIRRVWGAKRIKLELKAAIK